jgi:hypothetical protein
LDKKGFFAVSALLEAISREDFAIHLYNRQYHRDPFANVPFAPLYYVLDDMYFLKPSPVHLIDLLGIVEIEADTDIAVPTSMKGTLGLSSSVASPCH